MIFRDLSDSKVIQMIKSGNFLSYDKITLKLRESFELLKQIQWLWII